MQINDYSYRAWHEAGHVVTALWCDIEVEFVQVYRPGQITKASEAEETGLVTSKKAGYINVIYPDLSIRDAVIPAISTGGYAAELRLQREGQVHFQSEREVYQTHSDNALDDLMRFSRVTRMSELVFDSWRKFTAEGEKTYRLLCEDDKRLILDDIVTEVLSSPDGMVKGDRLKDIYNSHSPIPFGRRRLLR